MWSRSSSGNALQIAISRLPFRIHACSFFTTPCRDFSSSVLTSPFAAVSLVLDNKQHTQKENVSTHTHKMYANERAARDFFIHNTASLHTQDSKPNEAILPLPNHSWDIKKLRNLRKRKCGAVCVRERDKESETQRKKYPPLGGESASDDLFGRRRKSQARHESERLESGKSSLLRRCLRVGTIVLPPHFSSMHNNTRSNHTASKQATTTLSFPRPAPLQQLQRDGSTPRGARKTTAHTRTAARSLFLASALGNAKRTLSKDRQRHLQPLGNARLTLRKRWAMPSSALASMQDYARQGYGSFT